MSLHILVSENDIMLSTGLKTALSGGSTMDGPLTTKSFSELGPRTGILREGILQWLLEEDRGIVLP